MIHNFYSNKIKSFKFIFQNQFISLKLFMIIQKEMPYNQDSFLLLFLAYRYSFLNEVHEKF